MNYLLSYPRSGNTWMRYCIEFLTKRPTIGYQTPDSGSFDKISIGNFANLGTDDSQETILIKRHETSDIVPVPENKLILIVRDYKEVIIRHLGPGNTIMQHSTSDEASSNYTQLIDFYESFPGPKLIIHYEDLITDLESVLKKCLDLLGYDHSLIPDLLGNISSHKLKSLEIYGKSHTGGGSLKFHSRHLSRDEKISWDEYLRNNHTDIFTKYLERYSEK